MGLSVSLTLKHEYDIVYSMEDPIAVLRHNILGQLTVIKNALLFVLEGHAGEISEDTRKYLSEAYKRNEEVINTLIATRNSS